LRSRFGNNFSALQYNSEGSSLDGAIHFVCMDWRHLNETLAASRNIHSALENLCVWNKDKGGVGSFYRSKHELIFVFKVGTAPHINTIEFGLASPNLFPGGIPAREAETGSNVDRDPFESYPDGHRGLRRERAVPIRATGMTTVRDACDGVSGRV
jgi:hypothetical protein